MNFSTPPKVFIDTNVWFSAFYGSRNAEKLIKAHIEGKIKAVISQQVLEELVRNVEKKIPKAKDPLKDLLEAAPPSIIKDSLKISKAVGKWVNIKDQKIFQTAVNAKVDIFVTGNIKDFSAANLEKEFGIKILSPKKAVNKLGLIS